MRCRTKEKENQMAEALITGFISAVATSATTCALLWLATKLKLIPDIFKSTPTNYIVAAATISFLAFLLASFCSVMIIMSYIAGVDRQIAALNKRIDGIKIVVTRSEQLNDISAPTADGNCPGVTDFVYGFRNASASNQALDGWRCAQVQLEVPRN